MGVRGAMGSTPMKHPEDTFAPAPGNKATAVRDRRKGHSQVGTVREDFLSEPVFELNLEGYR